LEFYRVSSGFKQINHLFVIEDEVDPRWIDTVNFDFFLDESLEEFTS
jgi:hypothetical protein